MPQLPRCRPVLASVPRSVLPRPCCSTRALRPLRALLLAPGRSPSLGSRSCGASSAHGPSAHARPRSGAARATPSQLRATVAHRLRSASEPARSRATLHTPPVPAIHPRHARFLGPCRSASELQPLPPLRLPLCRGPRARGCSPRLHCAVCCLALLRPPLGPPHSGAAPPARPLARVPARPSASRWPSPRCCHQRSTEPPSTASRPARQRPPPGPASPPAAWAAAACRAPLAPGSHAPHGCVAPELAPLRTPPCRRPSRARPIFTHFNIYISNETFG
jgi:hypothetical protein